MDKSEWTLETLKELMDVKFAASREAIAIASTASEKAILKAELANDRRLDLLNEFRAQQADEARKYALSQLVDQRFVSVEGRIGRGESAIATLQGRSLALAGFGAMFGGVVGAFVVKIFN